MSINIGPPVVDELKPKIAVIGVGGAGGNAIANMIAAHVEGVDFIVANTDAQALNSSPAEHRIQLGPDITEGLGAGARPEVGRAAAEETIDVVERALEGAHMCFIAAGMGGGTGTGAAPVIAQAARNKNILTVGVVTKPFMFEGTRRMRAADAGIEELQRNVDTLIVIPNQNLFLVANPNTTFKEAFQLADEVLQHGVRSITDLMVMPGLINLDFADVRSVMHEMGKAMMGTGEAEGDNRALEAAERAINNPLLDGVSMKGAKGVIVSIVGGDDMGLLEVDAAANHIRELVDPEANIIWGSAFNNDLQGKIRVSVVATGIDSGGMTSAVDAPRAFSLSQAANRPKVSAAAPLGQEPLEEPVMPAAEKSDAEAVRPYDTEPAASHADMSVADEAPVAERAFADDVRAQSPVSSGGAFSRPPLFDAVAEEEGSEPNDGDDMLELGSSDIIADTPEPAPAPPSRAPVGEGAARPRISTGGGTLFERMTNLARGGSGDAAESGDGGGDEPINIPRFLNRQNNK